MSIVVKNNIHWVGQRDWEVRDFHGTEYKTLRGSSYNSYLIREEKNVLIDTVDHKFSREFVQNLRNEIDLADIDYIVIKPCRRGPRRGADRTDGANSRYADLLYCQRYRLDKWSSPSSGVEF